MAESISEGTLKTWLKQVGDSVAQDEEVATIETDKVCALFVVADSVSHCPMHHTCASSQTLALAEPPWLSVRVHGLPRASWNTRRSLRADALLQTVKSAGV